MRLNAHIEIDTSMAGEGDLAYMLHNARALRTSFLATAVLKFLQVM